MGFARDSGGAAGAGGAGNAGARPSAGRSGEIGAGGGAPGPGDAGCGAADGGGRRRINITGALIDPVSLDGAARIVARLAFDGRAALAADSATAGRAATRAEASAAAGAVATGDAGANAVAGAASGATATDSATVGAAPGNTTGVAANAAANAVAGAASADSANAATSSAATTSAAATGAETGAMAGAAGSAFQAAYVCTPNAEILMMAQRDRQLMDALNGADLAVADGAGVVLAARILGYGRIDRTPGFDLTKKLFSDPAAYPFSYWLFGGKPGVAEAAAEKIVAESPRARIAGCRDGYFAEPDEPGIIDAINASGADILLVALGAPKQEKWIRRNRERLRVPVCIGVGGSLDVYAGGAALPPEFFRRHGLEWLFRLARQPWRAARMLRLPQYVLCAARHRLAGSGAPAGTGAKAGRRAQ